MKHGRPFVGRAGKFLTKTLAEYGIKREDIFITNIVKHISPKNRKPYPDEVAACLPYLNTQISIIKPKIIVLLRSNGKRHASSRGHKIHASYSSLSSYALYKYERKIQASNL